jgi:hypothetical protein
MNKTSLIVLLSLILGTLTAHSREKIGTATIKGKLDSITPTHFVIRTSEETVCYVKKSDVDRKQRRRLREINQFVIVTVDMTKVQLVRRPAASKPQGPPAGINPESH